AAFGGDDGLRGLGRVRLEPAADDLLGDAERIDIGGIDEISAPCEIVVENLVGGGFVRLVAKGHGAEAIGGHDRAAVAQFAVVHLISLLDWLPTAAGRKAARP